MDNVGGNGLSRWQLAGKGGRAGAAQALHVYCLEQGARELAANERQPAVAAASAAAAAAAATAAAAAAATAAAPAGRATAGATHTGVIAQQVWKGAGAVSCGIF